MFYYNKPFAQQTGMARVTITHHFKETLIVGCNIMMQIIY